MTRSTQAKFTDLLATECKSRGLELIVNTEWGNTGQYAIHGSALAPLLVMDYNWQTSSTYWRGGGYVTLKPDRPIPGIPDHAIHYADLDAALASILALFAPIGGRLR